jgi:exopolyphosphatase/guanosine-5'-triphosphate,3'-diphosphate pyrophosphatase
MTPDTSSLAVDRLQAVEAQARDRRHAVVDVGSNSIRLVVFDGLKRAPLPLYNEKVMCGLGRRIDETGRLDADGVELALVNLRRFAELIPAMGAETVDAVATAAVRDAADGAAFVDEVRRSSGLGLEVLSGPEEAELSALGVIAGMPEADGVVGDLGGGSLELVRVAHAAPGEQATLPFGPLRMQALGAPTTSELCARVDRVLAEVPWLGQARGSALYAVGGSWRALARIHIAQEVYPLSVIHRYRVRAADLADLARLVAHQSRESLQRLEGMTRRRLDVLPRAALVLERLIAALEPSEVVFSAYGLREGLVYHRLSPAVRRQDPLISACRDYALRAARFPEHAAELFNWTRKLFANESAEDTRLRHAACLLSDIGWRIHPDYRAAHAFNEVLYHPALHTDHAGRAFLALAVFARYTSKEPRDLLGRIQGLIGEDAARRARIVGLAARLGETISGGVPGMIERLALRPARGRGLLRLRYTRRDERLIGEVVVKRLEALARAMELAPELELRSD